MRSSIGFAPAGFRAQVVDQLRRYGELPIVLRRADPEGCAAYGFPATVTLALVRRCRVGGEHSNADPRGKWQKPQAGRFVGARGLVA